MDPPTCGRAAPRRSSGLPRDATPRHSRRLAARHGRAGGPARHAPPAPGLAARATRLGERVFDVTVALLALLVVAPLLPVLALAVHLGDGGPVLYRGRRLGRDRRPFTIYKFRTLVLDAEKHIGSRLLSDGDHVVTPVGRVLRELKLDELPQLVNVLRGDMRLVGPRPVRPALDRRYRCAGIPDYDTRFRVAPGLTGLAQVRGSYYMPMIEKVRWDVRYVHRRGAILDASILLETLAVPVKGLARLLMPAAAREPRRPVAALRSLRRLSLAAFVARR